MSVPAGELLPTGEEAPPPGVRAMGAVRWALVGLLAIGAVAAWAHHAAANTAVTRSERYRCPMHPAVAREAAGSCPVCGMALVPVERARTAERDRAVPGLAQVQLDEGRARAIGLATEPASRRTLSRKLRTVGFVAADEASIAVVSPRFSGWIEELRVAQTGRRVDQGEVLATLGGPELVTAQEIFLATLQRASGLPAARAQKRLGTDDERKPLRRLGMAEADIDAIARSGRSLPALPIRSPIAGHVASRSGLPGLFVQPGNELFEIADLSTVWVQAEVYEQDIGQVHPGQQAQITFPGYPGVTFTGTVQAVAPAVSAESRTLQARIALPNPELKLLPGMSAEVQLEVRAAEGLTVPSDAVVDTGEHQYVYVAQGGSYQARPVRLGASAGGRVLVVEGLAEGERVVTAGNFFLDSESRLRPAATDSDTAHAPAESALRTASGPP